MPEYYFTESIIKFDSPELQDKEMGHVETSEWLRKNDISYAGPRAKNHSMQSIKNGKVVNNLQFRSGILYARYLWKECAWKKSLEVYPQDTKENIRHFLDQPEGKKLVSYRYMSVDDEGKRELIKKYFMDYFVD